MRRSGKMKIAAALLLCSTVVLGACGSESSQNKETAKVTEAAGTAASTESVSYTHLTGFSTGDLL